MIEDSALVNAVAPFLHLVTDPVPKRLDTYWWPVTDNRITTFRIRACFCRSLPAFYKEISAALQFPIGFGNNIHALEDCLGDLDWIRGNSIAVVVWDASEFLVDETADLATSVLCAIERACVEQSNPVNAGWPSNQPARALHFLFVLRGHEVPAFSQHMGGPHWADPS